MDVGAESGKRNADMIIDGALDMGCEGVSLRVCSFNTESKGIMVIKLGHDRSQWRATYDGLKGANPHRRSGWHILLRVYLL